MNVSHYECLSVVDVRHYECLSVVIVGGECRSLSMSVSGVTVNVYQGECMSLVNVCHCECPSVVNALYRYLLKAVRTLAKRKKTKKIISFRQNLFGSTRPVPEPIHLFVLGAMSILWEAPKKGAYQPEERLQQKN